jgi:AraC-like DNA-binding protein
VKPLTVNTIGVSGPERFDFWREVVADTFVPLRCEHRTDLDARAFNGQLRSLRLDDLQITEVAATPHIVVRSPKLISKSIEEFYKISLQLAGVSVLTQDGRDVTLRPGDFAVYDTTRPYSIQLGPSYRTLVLLVPRRRLRISPDRMAAITACPIPGQGGAGMLLSPFLRKFASLSQPSSTWSPRLTGNIIDLVDTLLAERIGAVSTREESSRRVLMLSIMAFIERELGDPELGAEKIAAAHFISTRYLYKLFQAEDETVASWIRSQRLERCRRDLRDPLLRERSVCAIAARWGYTDAAHFSRAFRTAYGVCPREYRLASQPTATEYVEDRGFR